MIENAEASLAKTDLYIARRYAALVQPASLREKYLSPDLKRNSTAVVGPCFPSFAEHRIALPPTGAGGVHSLAQSLRRSFEFLQIRFLNLWRKRGRRGITPSAGNKFNADPVFHLLKSLWVAWPSE